MTYIYHIYHRLSTPDHWPPTLKHNKVLKNQVAKKYCQRIMKNRHDHQIRATWNLGANGPGISSSVSKWLLVESRATLGWWGVGELSSWIASELWWGGRVPLVEGEGKPPLLKDWVSLWWASCFSWEEKTPRLISSLDGGNLWEELPLIWIDMMVMIMMMMEV